VYALKTEYDSAVADFTVALDLDAGLTIAYVNRGNAYNNLGNTDLALVDYGKAIEMSPDFAIAYYSRGLVYRNRGETDKAIADFQKAVELSAGDGLGDLAQEQLTE